MLNRSSPEPEFPQLSVRYDSVLTIGKLTQESVRRARSHFDSYVMAK